MGCRGPIGGLGLSGAMRQPPGRLRIAMRTGTADAFRSPRLARNSFSSFDMVGCVRTAAGVKLNKTACLSPDFDAVRALAISSPVPSLIGLAEVGFTG